MTVLDQGTERSISPAAATMLGAGALLALGSLLPWATASTPFGSISKNGTSGDGVITLILAAIGILCGILSLRGEKRKTGWTALGAVAFLLAGATSIYDMSTLPIPSTNLVIVSVGMGLWLCAIGAIVGLVASCYATYEASKASVVTADSLGGSASDKSLLDTLLPRKDTFYHRPHGDPPGVLDGVNPKPPVVVPSSPSMVADELTKLAKLKADGVLSESEFDGEKAKLLGGGEPR